MAILHWPAAEDAEGGAKETSQRSPGHCPARAQQGGGPQPGHGDAIEQLYQASLGHGHQHRCCIRFTYLSDMRSYTSTLGVGLG